MASMQCYKPSNETCQQKCHENSLGQKVPEMAGHVLVLKGKNPGSETSSQTYCKSQTEIQAQYKSQSIIPDHTTSKTQTQCYSQTQTKKRGEHKKKERRNLLQKIKDGLSGHSSDSSGSSSESDSDNDNCKCEKRKN
ncbi:hypothetical protein ACB094_01G141400 [Castanea mollissima]